ncbi:hypothetical protein ColTof4_14353 [Colletotrichum tofieldiae]|nr:hypothetical protein ColTof3_14764 [Colletotrichum tofieldiae]GKT81930.1 hypothetical protein ColTof4_14353 [Colletotrichum tofieldiae]
MSFNINSLLVPTHFPRPRLPRLTSSSPDLQHQQQTSVVGRGSARKATPCAQPHSLQENHPAAPRRMTLAIETKTPGQEWVEVMVKMMAAMRAADGTTQW